MQRKPAQACDQNTVLLNLAEGILRLAIFVLYVLAISKIDDVKKTLSSITARSMRRFTALRMVLS